MLCRKIIDNVYYQNLFLLCIFAYILNSALEGSIPDSKLFLANFIFVLIFSFDFILKIIWMGLTRIF